MHKIRDKSHKNDIQSHNDSHSKIQSAHFAFVSVLIPLSHAICIALYGSRAGLVV
jgi:hypothetical protein